MNNHTKLFLEFLKKEQKKEDNKYLFLLGTDLYIKIFVN